MFKIEAPDDTMIKSSQIILRMCEEVGSALKQVRKIKEEQIRKTFMEVHKLENEMDEIAKFFERVLLKKEAPNKIKADIKKFRKNFQTLHYCFQEAFNGYDYHKLI